MGFDLSTGWQVLPYTQRLNPYRIWYWQRVAGLLADDYHFKMSCFSSVNVAWKPCGYGRCTYRFTLFTN